MAVDLLENLHSYSRLHDRFLKEECKVEESPRTKRERELNAQCARIPPHTRWRRHDIAIPYYMEVNIWVVNSGEVIRSSGFYTKKLPPNGSRKYTQVNIFLFNEALFAINKKPLLLYKYETHILRYKYIFDFQMNP